MRKTLFALAIGVAAMPMLAFAQQSPIGKWKTIDDETGKAKSIVEITQASNGTLQGRVIEILQSEIARVKAQLDRKRAVRAAADALFQPRA